MLNMFPGKLSVLFSFETHPLYKYFFLYEIKNKAGKVQGNRLSQTQLICLTYLHIDPFIVIL